MGGGDTLRDTLSWRRNIDDGGTNRLEGSALKVNKGNDNVIIKTNLKKILPELMNTFTNEGF